MFIIVKKKENTKCKYNKNTKYAPSCSKTELFLHINYSIVNGEFTKEDYKRFIDNKADYYNTFYVNKKNGEKRRIDEPIGILKEVQRYVLYNHLYTFYIHPNATGFVKNRSIMHNARRHLGQDCIYNLDLRDFFPSLHKDLVKEIFTGNGYSNKCAIILSEICTLYDVLPQGSPASPAISNIICLFMDTRLSRFANATGLNYSRYADDITFSGNNITTYQKNTIKKIIEECGFSLALEKERVAFRRKCQRQVVSGIIVNDKLSLGRKKFNMLRAMLHQCELKGVEKVQKESDMKSGPGYFIKNDLSDMKKNFFNYLMGIVGIYEHLEDFEKSMYIIEKMKIFEWSNYFEYRLKKLKKKRGGVYASDLVSDEFINKIPDILNKKFGNLDYNRLLKEIEKIIIKIEILHFEKKEESESYDSEIFEKEKKELEKLVDDIGIYDTGSTTVKSAKQLLGKDVELENESFQIAPEVRIKIISILNLYIESKKFKMLLKDSQDDLIHAEHDTFYEKNKDSLRNQIIVIERETRRIIFERFKTWIQLNHELDNKILRDKDVDIIKETSKKGSISYHLESYSTFYNFCFEDKDDLTLEQMVYILPSVKSCEGALLFSKFIQLIKLMYGEKTSELIDSIILMKNNTFSNGISIINIRQDYIHGKKNDFIDMIFNDFRNFIFGDKQKQGYIPLLLSYKTQRKTQRGKQNISDILTPITVPQVRNKS